MSKSKIAGLIAAAVVVACLVFIVLLLPIKLLWAWTVPDLFPGAVSQGLVAAEISWLTAAKIALFMAILGAFAGGTRAQRSG